MPDLAELLIRIDSKQAAKARDELDRLDQTGRKVDDTLGRKVPRAGENAGRAFTKTSGTASALVKQLGLMVGAFSALHVIRSAVSTMIQFERTMSQLEAVAIRTNAALKVQHEQMRALEAQARQLGATTRYTAAQAGEAQLFLARAGFEVNEILAATPGTLNLATAGVLDLGRAADIASNVLTQFNLKAKEMARVGDVLVATANRANTNVEQLSEALKLAGPVAGALGIPLEDVAAGLGTLGNAGIQASMAGTTMRGVLLGLIGPTKRARETMDALARRLGTTRDAFDLTKNSLLDVFEAFDKAGTTAKEFNEIFARRQAGGGIRLSQDVAAFRALRDAVAAAGGEADRVAKKMDQNLGGALLALKSAFEELTLQTGDRGLVGALKFLVQTLTDVFRVLGGLGDQVQGNRILAEGLGLAIKLLIGYFGALLALKVVAWLKGVALAIGGVVKALALLRVAALANPFTAILTGLVALAIALDHFIGDWGKALDSFVRFTENAVNGVIAILKSLIDTMVLMADRTVAFWASFGEITFDENFFASVGDVGNAMKAALDPTTFWAELQQVWGENFDRRFVRFAKDEASAAGEDIGEALSKGVNEVWKKQIIAVEEATALSNLAGELEAMLAPIGKTEAEFRRLQAIQSAEVAREDAMLAIQVERLKQVRALEKEIADLRESGVALDDSALTDGMAKIEESVKEATESIETDFGRVMKALDDLEKAEALVQVNQMLADLNAEALALSPAAEAVATFTRALEKAFPPTAAGDSTEFTEKMREFMDLIEFLQGADARAAAKEAGEALEELAEAAQKHFDTIGMTEKQKQAYEAAALAAKAFAGGVEDANDRLAEYLRLLDAIEQKEAGAKFEDMLKNLREQVELIGKTERQKAIIEATRVLLQAYGDDHATINAHLAEYMRLWDQVAAAAGMERMKSNLELLKELSRDLATAFTRAFEAFIFGEMSAKEAALRFAQDVSRILFERIVAQPLIELLTKQLTSAFSASGLNISFAPQAQAAGVIFGTHVAGAGQTFTSSTQVASAIFTGGIQAAGAQLIASAEVAAAIMAGGSAGSGIASALGGIGAVIPAVGGGVGAIPVAPPAAAIPSVGGCGPGG